MGWGGVGWGGVGWGGVGWGGVGWGGVGWGGVGWGGVGWGGVGWGGVGWGGVGWGGVGWGGVGWGGVGWGGVGWGGVGWGGVGGWVGGCVGVFEGTHYFGICIVVKGSEKEHRSSVVSDVVPCLNKVLQAPRACAGNKHGGQAPVPDIDTHETALQDTPLAKKIFHWVSIVYTSAATFDELNKTATRSLAS